MNPTILPSSSIIKKVLRLITLGLQEQKKYLCLSLPNSGPRFKIKVPLEAIIF